MVDFLAWAQLYDTANDYDTVCVAFAEDGSCTQLQGPHKGAIALNPERRGSWPYWDEGWYDPPRALTAAGVTSPWRSGACSP